MSPEASRREVLALIAATTASAPLFAQTAPPIRAIAFDAFVLFNTDAIVARVREDLGDMASAVVAAASAKLFAYSWYYTSAGRYTPFEKLAADAFKSAAQGLGLNPAKMNIDRIVAGYGNLTVWPDIPDALHTLRRHGIRLAMLSNLSERSLAASLRANGIDGQFESVLSTDRVQQYKPSPKAYAEAVRAFGVSKDKIGFAASAGWDASGATWFGFPTVWVNRQGLAAEPAHAAPRLVAKGAEGLLRLAGIRAI